MRRLSRVTLVATGALAAVLCAAPAAAKQGEQSFKLRAGALFSKVDTTIEVDPNIGAGQGSGVDLESDLGFRRRPTVGFVEGSYRFAPRWTANFQYVRIARSRSATLNRDIVVGDTTYPVNAAVSARFSSNVYMAHVQWSPIRTEKVEAGVSLGAHVTTFAFRISGVGSVGGSLAGAREERRTVTAPLPNAGLFASAEVLPRVQLHAKANYLKLRLGDRTGRLADLEAGIAYDVSRNIAIGTGYRHLGYRLDADQERFNGTVRYKFEGPILFVQASF